MKTLAITLAAALALSGCAAFCDKNDANCINKANAAAAGFAAGAVAVLAGALAAQASRPVVVCNRWGRCWYE